MIEVGVDLLPLGHVEVIFSPRIYRLQLGSKLDHSNTHRIDIYALGVDGYVYYKTWKDGSGWEEWYLVTGSYPGTPNVSNRLYGKRSRKKLYIHRSF